VFAIQIVSVGEKGRGVIARERILEETIVSRSPVVLVPLRSKHPIDDFVFDWDEKNDALALGPASFFNHSDEPNCAVARDYGNKSILIYTMRDIEPGEELAIDYGEVWFEVKP
jgi:uncharacterized protein